MKTLTRKIAVIAATAAVVSSGFVGGLQSASAGSNCTPGIPAVHRKPGVRRGLLRRQRERSSVHPCRRRVSRPGSDRYGLDADNDGRGCE